MQLATVDDTIIACAASQPGYQSATRADRVALSAWNLSINPFLNMLLALVRCNLIPDRRHGD